QKVDSEVEELSKRADFLQALVWGDLMGPPERYDWASRAKADLISYCLFQVGLSGMVNGLCGRDLIRRQYPGPFPWSRAHPIAQSQIVGDRVRRMDPCPC